MNVRDTAIPDSLANAARPAGRLTVASGGPRSVFAECQQTFLQSAVFLAVIPRFCCRAAVDRPRAPFLVTMSLHYLTNQAARANCSLAILFFAPFSESEQLGSHARPQKLMSKPVSPMFDCSMSLTANDCFRRPRGGAKHSVRLWPTGRSESSTRHRLARAGGSRHTRSS